MLLPPFRSLVLSFAALAGLAAGEMFADDAPIPVIREPHHHVALENAYVRTLEVRLTPGEQTLYHVHRLPSVVVELTRATISTQEWGGPAPAAHEVTPGDTRYAAYDEKPLMHRVANAGATLFHVMDVELLQPNAEPPNGFPPPLAPPARLLFQKKQVRAYLLTLGPSERIDVPATPAAHLLIAYSGFLEESTSGAASRLLRSGEEVFVSAGTGLSAANDSRAPANAILLELETTGPDGRL